MVNIPTLPTLPTLPMPPIEGEQFATRGSVYAIGKYIGKGSFGLVYECTDRWGNELVAKVLVPLVTHVDAVREAWVREAVNLVSLRHPNITYIYDVCEHKGSFYLIVERCGSDLNALFKVPNYDVDLWLFHIARDVLQAIEYIHREGYVHKDLHPGNIFVSWMRDRMVRTKDSVMSFKVGDLGITREEANIDIFNTMLAQWMLPPEALDATQFGPVGRGIDVYHIGLVLLSVLLRGSPTFTEAEILDGKPRQIAEGLQSRYASAVAQALRRHATARPSIAELWQLIVDATPRHLWPI